MCVLELVESRGALELEEIAALLGTTEGAIRKTICVAVGKLRRALERAEED